MTCFHKKNKFHLNEKDFNNDESTASKKLIKEKNQDDNLNNNTNVNTNTHYANNISNNTNTNINEVIKSEAENLKFYYNKSFINNFINEDFDKKTCSYSNIKWDENSLRNFDSNNDIFNILKSEKNLNPNSKVKLKKQNSNSTFNYNYLDENKNKNSNSFNKNEDKEILLLNKSSSRNNSDMQELLYFSDENYNSYSDNNYLNNNKNFNNEKFENSKDSINRTYNTHRSHSFEKMIYKQFGKSKEKKQINVSTNNNSSKNIKSAKMNFDSKKYKGSNPDNIKINNNNIMNVNYKPNELTENPINRYFEKRHLRELQKLDSLRLDKLNKEVSEIKDRPYVSDASKKIFAGKINQEKQSGQTVFDRLLAPSQVI